MSSHHLIIDATAKIATRLPGDVLESLAVIIESQQLADIRSRIADSVPHPQNRSVALNYVDQWQESSQDVTGQEIAMALRTAAHLEQIRQTAQSVEMVWTGPQTEDVPYRRTEQAILEVLNSAQKSLLLVSYAVYSIPNIQDAVVRAARRGVRITVVVETPSKLDVANEYSTIQALGNEVAACSRLFYWPQDNRDTDESGRHGILHVKCVVADGDVLFLSSANLTVYAFTTNMELGVLMHGGRMPKQIEAKFGQLIDCGVLCQV